MKTYRVFYRSENDVEELKQFNDLNEAIKYTESLLLVQCKSFNHCDTAN